MRITWLGHATVVLDLDGVRLLTDPLLRAKAGPLRRRGQAPTPAQVADVDAILISHLHHDHAELTSIRLLPPLPLITGPRNAAFLAKRKLPAVALTDQWYDVRDSGVQVRLVRADHHSRKMPHRPNDAYGHLVRTPTFRIWLAGDTSLYPEMAHLPDLAGGPIDLAVVPVGGWGPKLSGGHMDPEQAARACALVGAAAAVPYHWGTFHVPSQRNSPRGWMDRPGPAFAEAVAEHAPECEPRVLGLGESTSWEIQKGRP